MTVNLVDAPIVMLLVEFDDDISNRDAGSPRMVAPYSGHFDGHRAVGDSQRLAFVGGQTLSPETRVRSGDVQRFSPRGF